MLRRLTYLAVALTTLALPIQAWACGGFFCNFNNPVLQAAERILYVQQGPDVTVHVQIRYQGDADKFSWVLPLQKQPKLGIGSDSVFTVLEQATAPSYQLQVEYKPDCYYGCMYPMAGGFADASAADAGTDSAPVVVLAKEAVGPYDTVVIQGSTGADLKKWLDDNGYQQPAGTDALLDSYAKQGFVFLGLKLQKDKSAGDLAPIVATLPEVGPCLPIRLTAVAAQPDMPIVAWVLGQHRAIPKNFLGVQLNDKTIDWTTNGGNYLTVASKAVDQASGHAFLTEYAQPTAAGKLSFVTPGWDTAALAKIGKPGEFLNAMLQQNLPRTSQVQALIRKFVPKPKGYESMGDQQFYGCVQSTFGGDPTCSQIQAEVAKQPFDPKAFAQAIEDGVVKPLKEVQKAFDTVPYLTRLFTTLSAEEMTKDPIFSFNSGLADVSNLHQAKGVPLCDAGSQQASKVQITYADGSTLTVPVPNNGQGCYYPGNPQADGKGPIVAAGGQPAKSVQVLDESGPALDIDPTVADKVDAQLNGAVLGKPSLTAEFKKSLPPITWNADSPSNPTGGDTSPGSDISSGSDASSASDASLADVNFAGTPGKPAPSSGCTTSRASGSEGAIGLLLALTALVGLRRRRFA